MLSTKPGRLLSTIHGTAHFGAKGVWGEDPTETGVCRLALSDEDKKVKDWFVKETKSLGCQVKIDKIGNIFAVYPGQKHGAPTAIGSHLDTQPTGGRYDGILGVLSGLEILRTFHDNKYVPQYPVAAVCWCNEEGARFKMSIMGSSVWSGQYPISKAYNLESVTDGAKKVTVEDELKRIGYMGSIDASYEANPIAAHFELHIEQGPILEDNQKEIGIVTGVQGYTWFNATIKGKASHAGTTNLAARQDSLLAASRMITAGYGIAAKNEGLYTTGILTLEPGSTNVIPEEVKFTIDIRHKFGEKLDLMTNEVKQEFSKIAKEGNMLVDNKPLSFLLEHIYTSDPISFNSNCLSSIRKSALTLFDDSEIMEITSGAGHDSCSTSIRCPTAMIFIPSKDGISHNPVEYSTPEQIENGFKVLLNAIVLYDKQRSD